MNHKLIRIARVTTFIGLLALVPLLAACAKTSGAASSAAPGKAGAPVSSDATIKLVEPAAGGEVPAGTLTVKVETTGITFTMPSNTNVAGEGHVHFTLDDRPFVMSTEAQAEIEDVTAGVHTLKAELVQNDTQSFDPPIEVEIEFTAK